MSLNRTYVETQDTMPDIPGIFEGLDELLRRMLGTDPPWWLSQVLFIVIGTGLLLWLLLYITSQVLGLWQNEVRPKLYNQEQRSRVIRRQTICPAHRQ